MPDMMYPVQFVEPVLDAAWILSFMHVSFQLEVLWE